MQWVKFLGEKSSFRRHQGTFRIEDLDLDLESLLLDLERDLDLRDLDLDLERRERDLYHSEGEDPVYT